MRLLLVCAGLQFVLLAPTFAQEGPEDLNPLKPSDPFGEAGSGSWAVRLGLYVNEDGQGDGNPFLDEDLTVIEPIVLFDYNVSDTFGYSGQLSYDFVSSASIDRLSQFDAQSGASRDNFVGTKWDFRHRLSDVTDFSWNLSGSFEYDYFSAGLGGAWSRDLAPRDAVLRLSLQSYFDQVDIIRFDGSEEGSDDRTSLALTAVWDQVIDPRTRGRLGLTLASQTGFLETAYNAVVIEDPALPPNPLLDNMARGTEVTEEVPEDRMRTTLFGSVRRSFGKGQAGEVSARVYDDDWGIAAFDIQPKWIQAMDNGSRWELRYRYYSQGEADFFQESFTTLEPERTQDSELGDFDSHLLGGRWIWNRGLATTWDVGIDYLSRSDGIDHIFASVGWRKSF